jgi:hypothetical protein
MDDKKQEYPLSREAQDESTNLRTLEDKWAEHCGGKLLKYDGVPENISALKKEMGQAAGECGMVRLAAVLRLFLTLARLATSNCTRLSTMGSGLGFWEPGWFTSAVRIMQLSTVVEDVVSTRRA